VTVDWSGVGNASARTRLRAALQELGCKPRSETGFWTKLRRSRAKTIPEQVLVISDLANVVKGFQAIGSHRWTAAIRERRPYIVALVRTKGDMRLAAMVGDVMQASANRFMVCDFEPSGSHDLVTSLSRALSAGQPTSVVHASYSDTDEALWLEFGDGLRTTIRWSALGIDREEHGLLLETATPAEDFASVETLQLDGGIFDIDSGVLRALADTMHADAVRARAEESRESVGTRVRARRENAGLTQMDVAEQSGLDQALISKLERGKHRPRFDTLERYAKALGLTVSGLLAEV
jgi:DNA-binding XRE family transcriptional regulator